MEIYFLISGENFKVFIFIFKYFVCGSEEKKIFKKNREMLMGFRIKLNFTSLQR